jgi:hypothetical protein
LTGRPGRERGRAYLLQIEVNTRGDDDDDVAWLLYDDRSAAGRDVRSPARPGRPLQL